MSDKEFDSLFKSSFEDFEVEPSANSWEKISQELKQPKKKFPIFWMAAASIIIVLGIGISLFNSPTEVIKLRPETPSQLLSKVEYQNQNIDESKASILTEPSTQKASNSTKIAALGETKEVKKFRKTLIEEKNINEDATLTTRENVLDVTNLEEDLVRVKPSKKIKSVAQQMIEDEAMQNKVKATLNAELASAQTTTKENLTDDETRIGRKLKIKSVGDLVNFVVAKVDKREEKIIKVSKTEESDNEITGINLGLFKFRKADK
ncbi:hypothetical protein N9R54_03145 [Pelobium sp.]|nr:hypothetical protein [Pelobium sp.]